MVDNMHNSWSDYMGAGMGIGMWLFWIILIVIVALLFKAFTGGTSVPPGTTAESPMELLKKRYASGEIEQQEYERLKKELEK
jgi:putative membrane protein